MLLIILLSLIWAIIFTAFFIIAIAIAILDILTRLTILTILTINYLFSLLPIYYTKKFLSLIIYLIKKFLSLIIYLTNKFLSLSSKWKINILTSLFFFLLYHIVKYFIYISYNIRLEDIKDIWWCGIPLIIFFKVIREGIHKIVSFFFTSNTKAKMSVKQEQKNLRKYISLKKIKKYKQ